jgi:hypothetical protein
VAAREPGERGRGGEGPRTRAAGTRAAAL